MFLKWKHPLNLVVLSFCAWMTLDYVLGTRYLNNGNRIYS